MSVYWSPGYSYITKDHMLINVLWWLPMPSWISAQHQKWNYIIVYEKSFYKNHPTHIHVQFGFKQDSIFQDGSYSISQRVFSWNSVLLSQLSRIWDHTRSKKKTTLCVEDHPMNIPTEFVFNCSVVSKTNYLAM